MVVLMFGVAFQLSFSLEVIRFALFGQFDFLRWCFLGFFGETIRQDYQGCVFKESEEAEGVAAELHAHLSNVVRVDQFLEVLSGDNLEVFDELLDPGHFFRLFAIE
jgi:hypothetical protein